jgi:hypothetical protein
MLSVPDRESSSEVSREASVMVDSRNCETGKWTVDVAREGNEIVPFHLLIGRP